MAIFAAPKNSIGKEQKRFICVLTIVILYNIITTSEVRVRKRYYRVYKCLLFFRMCVSGNAIA